MISHNRSDKDGPPSYPVLTAAGSDREERPRRGLEAFPRSKAGRLRLWLGLLAVVLLLAFSLGDDRPKGRGIGGSHAARLTTTSPPGARQGGARHPGGGGLPGARAGPGVRADGGTGDRSKGIYRLSPVPPAAALRVPARMSIALLGLDSRRNSRFPPRADAIHVLDLRPRQGTATIYAFPRETQYVPVPGGKSEPIAHAYAYGGRRFLLDKLSLLLRPRLGPAFRIEHWAEVGFSRTMGILRLLGLKARPTLAWLRRRKGFVAGDWQRSYNQAMFIKGQAVRQIDRTGGLTGRVFLAVAHRLVRTSLSRGRLGDLLRAYRESDLRHHPERVEVVLMSDRFGSQLKKTRFDPLGSVKEIERFIESLPKEVRTRSVPMARFVRRFLAESKAYAVRDPKGFLSLAGRMYDQKVWQQVEETGQRVRLHQEYADAMAGANTRLGRHARAVTLWQEVLAEHAQDAPAALLARARSKLGKALASCRANGGCRPATRE